MNDPCCLALDDLRAWRSSGCPAADAPPVRLAVIGDPVAHSLSPAMHQRALDARRLGLRYGRLRVAVGEVAEAFALMRALGFVGANVTVPHKGEALAACGEVEATARWFGAVNTVVFAADGVTRGSNTDGPGLAAAVTEGFGRPLGSFRVAVAGAGGGAGRAAALQCALAGCPAVVLANRTAAKAEAVAADARRAAPDCDVRVAALDDVVRLRDALAGCDLLVNATSVGLRPDDPSPVLVELLRPDLAVLDMVYNPPETRLLAAARALGAPAANGLAMLVHQGALAFVRWFGGDLPLAEMRAGLQVRLR